MCIVVDKFGFCCWVVVVCDGLRVVGVIFGEIDVEIDVEKDVEKSVCVE